MKKSNVVSVFPDSAAEVTDSEVKKSRAPPATAGKSQLVKKGSLSKNILYITSSVWFVSSLILIAWNWEPTLWFNNALWASGITYAMQMLTTRLTKME